MRKISFQGRAFVSLLITIQGFIISVTGIVLYFAPPGRVANWSNWTLIGLTKTQWQAVHTIFSFLFVIFAGIHLYYNWKPFVNYIVSKVQKGIQRKGELVFASGISLIIFVMTVTNVPPFSTVMDFGAYLSDSWATEETEPPIPHAELMTLTEYIHQMDLEPSVVLNYLRLRKIDFFSTNATIQEIADANQMTPKELGEIIAAANNQKTPPLPGMGRMKLKDVCQRLQIPLEEAIHRLKNKGIPVKEDQTLKEIADSVDEKPVDIFNQITGQES